MKKFSRYFTFRGRAPRGELWKVLFTLQFLIMVAFLIVMLILMSFFVVFAVFSIPIPHLMLVEVTLIILAVPYNYVALATIVRRMHDLNWSAWWLLFYLLFIAVFMLGNIIFEKAGHFFWWMWIFVPPMIACYLIIMYGGFALLLKLGTEGANNYGDNPLEK